MAGKPVLQYSCCNEDTRSELRALDVAGRRVLSIAAAGGRAFGLLLGDPREVVAVDRNPVQVFLGELEVAAMRRLPRDAYLAFVGLRGDATRTATYAALRAALSDGARAYWDARPGDIAEGILHVGRCERGIARVAPLFRRALGRDVARIRAAATLAEQGALTRDLFERWPVRAVLAAVFNPIAGRFLLKDPVYYGEGRRAAAPYLRERLVTTLENHRFDECFVLNLFWDGHLRQSRALPEYLTEAGYETVRSRLQRLTFRTSCVIDLLRAEAPASIDAFSLSDLGGYLTLAEFAELLRQVERVASPGATVCIREYISEPTARVPWPEGLARRAPLEEELRRTDRSVGCTFVCASRAGASVPTASAAGA